MALALLVVGLLAGLLSGLLGIGGGVVIVPALTAILVYAGEPLPQALHTALTVSLATVLCNSFVAAVGHAMSGRLELRRIRWLLFGAGVGSFGTAALFLSHHTSATAYTVAVSQLLAAYLIWKRRAPIGLPACGPCVEGAFGAFTGAASALAGTGGGAYVSAYLCRQDASTPFRTVGAAAAAAGTTIGAGGMIGHMVASLAAVGAGEPQAMQWPQVALATLVIGGLVATPLGVRLSGSCNEGVLRRLLAAVVALSALYLASTATLREPGTFLGPKVTSPDSVPTPPRADVNLPPTGHAHSH